MTNLQAPAKSEYDDAFRQARIPYIYRGRRLSTTEGCEELNEYINSARYSEDTITNIGFEVIGSHLRFAAFPLLARASVLKEDNVFYVKLIELQQFIMGEGHEHLEPAVNADALFVCDMFDEGEPLPYTPYQRGAIQNFLLGRVERGHRNHYCTARGMQYATTWWTEAFLAQQCPMLRILSV